MMKIALLTCGRSDYSIYYDLIKVINSDNYFDLDIISFGTHNSKFFGNTKSQIIEDGFKIAEEINTILISDQPEDISTAMGLTMIKFSNIWKKKSYDVVLALGDRYEMFSAVLSTVPFNINIAHLHGGETTLGAIDDIFRDCITRSSKFHFTTTETHKRRCENILGKENNSNVFNVGAPAIDTILNIKTLTKEELFKRLDIPKISKFVLVTFHPETIKPGNNLKYTDIITKYMINHSDLDFIITLPNNDTYGEEIRSTFINLSQLRNNIHCFDALGRLKYYSAVKHSEFILGNSSSGIIEVASFGKYNINIGDRQSGRTQSDNTINVSSFDELIKAEKKIVENSIYQGKNEYYSGGATQKIIRFLKSIKI